MSRAAGVDPCAQRNGGVRALAKGAKGEPSSVAVAWHWQLRTPNQWRRTTKHRFPRRTPPSEKPVLSKSFGESRTPHLGANIVWGRARLVASQRASAPGP